MGELEDACAVDRAKTGRRVAGRRDILTQCTELARKMLSGSAKGVIPMRTFSGSDTEVVTIHASQDRVIAALTDPDRIKEALSDQLESGTKIDAHTAHWVRRSVEAVGVRFRGDYTVQYDHDGHGGVSWHTLGNGNMRSNGEARVVPIDAENTRVEYSEAIECEMEVNRFIAPVLKPIVERKIKQGVGAYLEKMKQVIER